MLKDEYKVIIISALLGLLLWLIDAMVDSYIFSHGSFLDSLIFDASLHEIYFRLFFAFTIILFGAIIARFLSKRKRAEKALQDSEERYRSLVESTEDSIYLVDRDYRYLFVNKKHLSRLGLSKGQFRGQSYDEFHSPEETKKFKEKVDRVFRTGESEQCEYKSQRDGKYFLQTYSPVKGLDGKTKAVTVISKDITSRKQIEEKLQTLSLTDELTGIYNRRGFLAFADQYFKIVNRQKRKIFMLYADLDNLKEVNDEFGHKEGDRALILTVNALKESFRAADIIARIGGDEFVVLQIADTSVPSEAIIARLQRNLEIQNKKIDSNYKLSLSVGIAYYDPEHPCSIDELLIKADKLMYEQKSNKKWQKMKSG